MNNAIISRIRERASTSHFDSKRVIPDGLVHALAELARRAPTAYNLQNWRLVAAHSPEAKARLRDIAYGQRKVTDAAVVYILCGQPPSHHALADRLQPSVEAGILPPSTAASWVETVEQTYANDSGLQRDEAIRSASLAAAFLIFAAEAYGLASCPMVGFDAERLAREFALAPAIWGSTYIVATELLPGAPPLSVATFRALPAGLILLLLVRSLPKGEWLWRSFILGALNFTIFWALLFVAA